MIEQLVARVFALRDRSHLAHWSTGSYSAHVALGDLYDGLIDKIDGIVEAYHGVYWLIGAVTPAQPLQGEVAACLDVELVWLDKNRTKIAMGSTLLENLLDDLMQLYATTRYKLVNLY